VNATGHDRTEALASRFREAFECFDRFATGALASAFGSVAHLVAQHRMKVHISEVDQDRRSFQFVTDDGSYLVVRFTIGEIGALDCSSECWIPIVGPTEGVRTSASLGSADRRWGEACLLMALDSFLLKCTEARCRRDRHRPGLPPGLGADALLAVRPPQHAAI
jgi:hypothetical protein